MSITNGVPVPPVDRRVSIYDIAEETGYSPSGIHRALDRLGIEPEDVTPGGVRYFSPLAIEKLREHMRTKPKNGDS
jgi:DNA-binding transcriptional MerR regulator